MSNYKKESLPVYCWELKRWFQTQREAGFFLVSEGYSTAAVGEINKVLDNPTRTVGGYHWCTNKRVFRNKVLSDNEKKEAPVFCWETKKWYSSIYEASKKVGISKNNIVDALDNPLITAKKFHWSTTDYQFNDIDFSNIESNFKTIYCYETGEEFTSDSDSTAIEKIYLTYKDKFQNSQIYNLKKCINNPKRTYFTYHWCTEKYLENSEIESNKKSIYSKKTRVDSFVEKEFITREIVPEGVDYSTSYKFPILLANDIHDYLLKKEYVNKLDNPEFFYYFKIRAEYDITECKNGCTNYQISVTCKEHTKLPPEIKYKIFHSVCPNTKIILDEILSLGRIPDMDVELEWDENTNTYSIMTSSFLRSPTTISENDEVSLEDIYEEKFYE